MVIMSNYIITTQKTEEMIDHNPSLIFYERYENVGDPEEDLLDEDDFEDYVDES